MVHTFDKGVGFFLLEEEDYCNRISVYLLLDDKTVHSIVDNLDNLVSEIFNVITNWTISFKDEIGMTKMSENGLFRVWISISLAIWGGGGGAAMGPKNSCEYADCAMDEI